MALFKLPLSGDVVQWINPVTWFASGNQISTNVYLGESSSPETEAEILDRVGTYGRQLGQITDAMIVLVRHLPDRESLPRKESDVIKAARGRQFEPQGTSRRGRCCPEKDVAVGVAARQRAGSAVHSPEIQSCRNLFLLGSDWRPGKVETRSLLVGNGLSQLYFGI